MKGYGLTSTMGKDKIKGNTGPSKSQKTTSAKAPKKVRSGK